ncbi:MAG: ABC transporter ATP-binding protein [Clostridia bacterium]|nr:ABC transporter ATP-binding protein [Clostridia bacterium]
MGPGGFGPGGPGGPGGPHDKMYEKLKEPKPTSIREVPGYLKRLIGGFLYRLVYIYGLVWETKPWILFVMLFMAVFEGVMPVIGALISANLINSVADAYVGNIGFKVLAAALIVQFIYLFIQRLVNQIYHILRSIAGELVTNHIKVKIVNKAKDIDLADYDMPEFYEKLENANREAGNRPIQILNSTFGIMSTIISMVSFIAILWAVSPIAPFIIIAISVPTAIVNFVYRRKTFSYMRRRSKDRREMNYYSNLMVNKDMVKEIRMFDLSDIFIGRYKDVFGRYFKGLKGLIMEEGLWNIGITVITISVNCALFLYIAYKVSLGELNVGDYQLYTGALNSIIGGVGSIISTTATIYEGTLFIDNMITFMNEEKKIVPLLACPVKPARHCGHEIVFEDVCFSYPGTEREVLSHVNLTLRPGETAVLVGLNGAGKTTLIKLLTRLYDPTSGRILLDGRDIREYDTEALYDMFGIIFQDFGKYAVTVRENIAFGDSDREIVEDEIQAAAVNSNSLDFIEHLPDGFDTPLMRYFEENGIELSIGQWQKLAVARAFYSDSDILILDEPTASLDPMAEQEIFNQFDKLKKDKTTIFVSHRLSSAATATKIIVLEYGRVIEEGTHGELMAKQGRYYELFSTQAKRYITQSVEIPVGMELPMPGDGGENRIPHRGRPPMPPGGMTPHGMPPHGGRPPHGDFSPMKADAGNSKRDE